MAYTTAQLLIDIKQAGMFPSSQTTFSDEKILETATRAMRSKLVPYLSSTREGYFIWNHNVALEDGVRKYDIPERAIALALNDVLLVDSSGSERSIPQIPAYERDEWAASSSTTYAQLGFYLEWNKICLTQDPQGSYSALSLPYQIRLGKLVGESEAGRITSIDVNTKTITLNNLPDDFTASIKLDFIRGSGGYEYLQIDNVIASVDTNAVTVTLTSDLPDSLVVGDWVAYQYESPIPQIPEELLPILTYQTVEKILNAQGDFERAKIAAGERRELEEDVMKVVSPRVKGETKFVNTGHRRSSYFFNGG